MRKHYLYKVFEPASVAVVGASERDGSVGRQVLKNIIEYGFKGDVYPVNHKHDDIQGLKSYRSISDIDHPVDLAVIAVPAKAIPGVMTQDF